MISFSLRWKCYRFSWKYKNSRKNHRKYFSFFYSVILLQRSRRCRASTRVTGRSEGSEKYWTSTLCFHSNFLYCVLYSSLSLCGGVLSAWADDEQARNIARRAWSFDKTLSSLHSCSSPPRTFLNSIQQQKQQQPAARTYLRVNKFYEKLMFNDET